MNNYVELLKFFLTKLPQADAKNIYDKMPIDLTTDKEMKNLLKEYLKQNEHSFHKIKIYQTSDSKMKNLIEPQIERDSKGDFSQGLITFSSKNNPKPNLKKKITIHHFLQVTKVPEINLEIEKKILILFRLIQI